MLVLFGSDSIQLTLRSPIDLAAVKLFQKRNAPAATSPRAAAFRKLTGDARPGKPNEVHQLAAGNMETVADLGIKIHSLLEPESFAGATGQRWSNLPYLST